MDMWVISSFMLLQIMKPMNLWTFSCLSPDVYVQEYL